MRWDVIREHGIFGKDDVRADAHAGLRRQRLDATSSASCGSPAIRARSTSRAGTIRSIATTLEMTGQVRALNYLKECRGGRASSPIRREASGRHARPAQDRPADRPAINGEAPCEANGRMR